MTNDEHWALWRADPRATPFQSPAWVDAWWTHLNDGERVNIEVRIPRPFASSEVEKHNESVAQSVSTSLDTNGRGGGALIATLPCFVWRDGPVRRLVPAGAGISDYSDALLAAPETAGALWEAIAREEWDEVLLPDLRPDSPMLGDLPAGLIAEDAPQEVCPVLTIPVDGRVLAGLSKSRRRKIVHDRNRADALGGVTTEFATGDGVEPALDALFALHAARWRAEGQEGVLADPKVQAFHRAAAAALDAAGLLRLAVVRHAGRIVAVLHGFADGARGHSYINGVDGSVPGQSFGTLAFAASIERAAAEGAREFHFLRGEEAYKYAWDAAPRGTVKRVVRRAGTRAPTTG